MKGISVRLFTLSAVCALAGAFTSCSFEAPKITAPRYALVYGIKNYPIPSGGAGLLYTVKDADSIASILTTQGWTVNEYTDTGTGTDSVTKEKIRAAIVALATVASDSTILIYYSGHGTYVDSSWGSDYYPRYSGAYICPYDSVESTPGLSYGYIDSSTVANLISPSELQTWIAQAGTRNVIVILDSCNSGGFVSSSGALDASPQNYFTMASYSAFSTAMSNFGGLLVANASASGAKTPIVISAAGTNESSYDGDSSMAHGVFTYYLLQSATKGDKDGDGIVTTTEAYSYTAEALKSKFDSNPMNTAFLPHISGDTRDLVLFTK